MTLLDLSAGALVASFPPARRKTARGTVSYREAGTGPALCLLHGIGNQSGSWVRQLEALAPRFRTIAWDAPGYGESDRLEPESPSAADYASVFAAFLDALGIDRAVVIGASAGAPSAMQFALRHPDRCQALGVLGLAPNFF